MKTDTNGDLVLEGDVLCPNCGYEGQDYGTEKNIAGQKVLVCPDCDSWI